MSGASISHETEAEIRREKQRRLAIQEEVEGMFPSMGSGVVRSADTLDQRNGRVKEYTLDETVVIESTPTTIENLFRMGIVKPVDRMSILKPFRVHWVQIAGTNMGWPISEQDWDELWHYRNNCKKLPSRKTDEY